MLQWFIRFPKFAEFTEFNKISASFRKNSDKKYKLDIIHQCVSRNCLFVRLCILNCIEDVDEAIYKDFTELHNNFEMAPNVKQPKFLLQKFPIVLSSALVVSSKPKFYSELPWFTQWEASFSCKKMFGNERSSNTTLVYCTRKRLTPCFLIVWMYWTVYPGFKQVLKQDCSMLP